MPTEFTLPNLGDDIESVRVASVLVAVGDTVQAEQTVLELETDKALMELPAPVSGTVTELFVREEEDIAKGQRLMLIAEGVAPETDTIPEASKPEPAAASPKTDAEDSATEAAQSESVPAADASDPAPTPEAVSRPTSAQVQVPASPSVRRFAREIGIEISSVPGTGPQGRISTDDVKAYAKQLNVGRIASPAGGPAVMPSLPALPEFEKWGETKRESMSPVRLKTARQMHLCWSQIPHVTQFNQADITEIEQLRKQYAKRAEAVGGKLTMAVMVVKVVASALKMFPKFNCSIDIESKEIIYKDFVNVGIAVNTPRGLLVPVLRDVDKKNMVEISAQVMEVAEKARTGRVSMDDLSGGTFTVTNLGSIGGTHFTPIINFPEVAILGMGRAFQTASVVDGGVPRMVLPLSLSYDHRIIDGAEGAAFLKWIVDAVEQPLLLSLEG
jgi:pyruvate dehydrogenase E2 component (dihydrolipoamide acetyltransferase)